MTRQRPGIRTRRVTQAARAAACVLLVLAGDYCLYPRWVGIGGESLDRGENGLWLRYKWYFGERSDEEIVRLAEDLARRHIKYAYFHVRYITKDGTLRYKYPESAKRLVRTLHDLAPTVKVIAWVYAGNERGLGEVDLGDAGVREKMVGEAVWLVRECGFDGVQWDYEVCPNGDEDFLRLMSETRSQLPAGALLSTAVPMWAPRPFSRWWGWTEDYMARVAATCDQLAVMCYDYGQYLPRTYVSLVRAQAVRVPRAAARGNAQCTVLLGLPTYHEGPRAHHPHAENLRLSLKGVREGLQSGDPGRSAFAGVALFADYTTEAEEWALYEDLWLMR